jgi:hypothetical protein
MHARFEQLACKVWRVRGGHLIACIVSSCVHGDSESGLRTPPIGIHKLNFGFRFDSHLLFRQDLG